MPRYARVSIKTAMIYLAAAFGFGAYMAASGVFGFPLPAGLQPASVHLLVVGWLTQLIFGVAYWMFPKLTKAVPRGSDGLAWATYVLLNIGLILRAIAEPQLGSASSFGILLLIASVMQWVAGMLFVINTWGRVKER